MRVRHAEFREWSWEEACAEAERFINNLRPGQVISIVHVAEPPFARVFVWYRDEPTRRAENSGAAAREGVLVTAG